MQGNIFHDLIKIFVSGCSLVSGLEPSSRGELRERLSLGLGLRHLDLTDVTRLDDLSLRLILQASGACMEPGAILAAMAGGFGFMMFPYRVCRASAPPVY